MRGLAAVVAGTILSNSLYAAEPSLHTTPDPGYPLVQENADKALKVAYMVLGGICPDAEPEEPYHSPSIQTPKWIQRFTTIIDNSQVIIVSATDYFREQKKYQQDNLTITLYPQGISLEEIRRRREIALEEMKKIMKTGKIGQGFDTTSFFDIGFDGHPNPAYSYLPKNIFLYSLDQNLYLSTLDKIITACEGAKQ